MSKNKFLIIVNMIDIKMYMSEIFKFKISDLEAKKNYHFMDYETCLYYKGTPCIMLILIRIENTR